MRFEKWQALGNDYLVVEEPVDADTVRRLCHRHTGVGADGVLYLERTDEPGFVARLRIFNPDGSEAELSGNGAREALMWLHHRGWAPGPQFSIQTVAGEIRATVLDDRTCRVDMGRPRDHGDAKGGEWAGRKLEVGNPQFAIRLPTPDEVDALDLHQIGPPIENDPQFPNRTNVSFWSELGADR